jgi:hypothetical protein
MDGRSKSPSSIGSANLLTMGKSKAALSMDGAAIFVAERKRLTSAIASAKRNSKIFDLDIKHL